MTQERIEVKGTGSQAPYGIGEIIKTFAPTAAGLKKAQKYAEQWYNGAEVFVPKQYRAALGVSTSDLEMLEEAWTSDGTEKKYNDRMRCEL